MNYFIDTNIFLRVLVKEDIKQSEECFKLLEKIKTNTIEGFTAGIILAEIVWTLKSYYAVEKNQVINSLKAILHLSGLKIIDGYDHNWALKLYGTHNVKYVDCLIASLKPIKNHTMTIVSYDRDFNSLPVLTKTPSSLT